MPLIKYYNHTTTYDGSKDFLESPREDKQRLTGKGRFYPDEYLIASILRQYVDSQSGRMQQQRKRIEVVTEPWHGDNTGLSTRNGGKNTQALNEQVLQKVDQALKPENGEMDTLILVPFLYGYHHPGIAIQLSKSKKRAIYLDPFGGDCVYDGVQPLLDQLKAKGLTVKCVKTKQQSDGVSCGPILTASMIQWIESFLNQGSITTHGFTVRRAFAVTDRLFQMYVHNRRWSGKQALINPNDQSELTAELMLADASLWKLFLEEQRIVDPKAGLMLQAVVEKQKNHLQNRSNYPLFLAKLRFICDFQSRLIEKIFWHGPLFDSEALECFIACNQVLESVDLQAVSETHAKVLPISQAQDLLSETPYKERLQFLGLPLKVDESKDEEEPAPAELGAALPEEQNTIEPLASHVYSRENEKMSLLTRIKTSMQRHPLAWGLAKWLALGAATAMALYFSGGFAAVPYMAQLGAWAVPLATPILALVKATLWIGVVKPAWAFIKTLVRNGYSRRNNGLPQEEEPLLQQRKEKPQDQNNDLSQAQDGPLLPLDESGWYDTDMLERLIRAPLPTGAPRGGLNYVFLPREDETQQKKLSFANQLLQLWRLKKETGAPFACFIAMEPGLFNASHFIMGLVVSGRLVIINPMGSSRRKGFYGQLVEAYNGLRDEGLAVSEVIISETPIQNDPEKIQSCGPICVELVRHLSSLSMGQINSYLDKAVEEGQLRNGGFPYHAIELNGSGLLPRSLQELLGVASPVFSQKMEALRRKHGAISNTEECSNESLILSDVLTTGPEIIHRQYNQDRIAALKEQFNGSKPRKRLSVVPSKANRRQEPEEPVPRVASVPASLFHANMDSRQFNRVVSSASADNVSDVGPRKRNVRKG